MVQRERLIDTLTKTFDEQYEKRMLIAPQHTADSLLADGWIRPPVKINQTVYVIDRADIQHPIKEKIVLEIQYGYSGSAFILQDTPFRFRRAYKFGDIGITVFLTREEAERELERRNK